MGQGFSYAHYSVDFYEQCTYDCPVLWAMERNGECSRVPLTSGVIYPHDHMKPIAALFGVDGVMFVQGDPKGTAATFVALGESFTVETPTYNCPVGCWRVQKFAPGAADDDVALGWIWSYMPD